MIIGTKRKEEVITRRSAMVNRIYAALARQGLPRNHPDGMAALNHAYAGNYRHAEAKARELEARDE